MDIFRGMPLTEVNKLGSQGALSPINQYLDQLPNFKKLYADDPANKWVLSSWSDENNNLYTWPLYGLNQDMNHGFLYRKDVFDKLGIQEWTNTDEFYAALNALKQAYPHAYPYASKTWKSAYTQPEYKDMFDFMKKLYDEGLLDPEYVTDTPDCAIF